MQSLSFDEVVAAVLVANVATILLIFGLVRVFRENRLDWWSVGSILAAVAFALPSLYFAA